MDSNFWKNRKVFLTGHTGFKGGWTALWLSTLGAKVYGYSLKPPTNPNFFNTTKLNKKISQSIIGDILNLKKLTKVMSSVKPSIVIHMAAQPLVRVSYNKPIETFMTNIIGTANVIEASRKIKSIKTLVNITTDKCYENTEKITGYKESDPLGGHDPYSSSKACAEILTAAYRRSFFFKNNLNINTVRAGNVLGGGDWSQDRLIPDFFRSLDKGSFLKIRYPNAIRPWQHVLDAINGYLILVEKSYDRKNNLSSSWNFGPDIMDSKKVIWIIKYLSNKIKGSKFSIEKNKILHENSMLNLDSSKAKKYLGWKNIWSIKETLDKTLEWHQAFYSKKNMLEISIDQIKTFENNLKKKRNK
jgi:CDP-glucose 4,6-dehydratase